MTDKKMRSVDAIGLIIQGDRLPDYVDVSNDHYFLHHALSTCRTTIAETFDETGSDEKSAVGALASIGLDDIKPWKWQVVDIQIFDVTDPDNVQFITNNLMANPPLDPKIDPDSLIDAVLDQKTVNIDWSPIDQGSPDVNETDVSWPRFLSHELTRPAPWPQWLNISHCSMVPKVALRQATKVLLLPVLELNGVRRQPPHPSLITPGDSSNSWFVARYDDVATSPAIVACAKPAKLIVSDSRFLKSSFHGIKTSEQNVYSQNWLAQLKYKLASSFKIGFLLRDWVAANDISANNDQLLAVALDTCSWLPNIDWSVNSSESYLRDSVLDEVLRAENFSKLGIGEAKFTRNLKGLDLQLAEWKQFILSATGHADWSNDLETKLTDRTILRDLLLEQFKLAWVKASDPLTQQQIDDLKIILDNIDLNLRCGLQLVKKVFGPLFLSDSDESDEAAKLARELVDAFEIYFNARCSTPAAVPQKWQATSAFFDTLKPDATITTLAPMLDAAKKKLQELAASEIFGYKTPSTTDVLPRPVVIQVDEVRNPASKDDNWRLGISGYGVLMKQTATSSGWRCLNMASPKFSTGLVEQAWLVPTKVTLEDDVRCAFITYNNHPLAATSPADKLDDAARKNEPGTIEYFSYEPVPAKVSAQHSKLPMLKFGATYQAVPFPIWLGGALPPWLADVTDPKRFHPTVLRSLASITPPALSVINIDYKRTIALGAPTFKIDMELPPTPERVYPLADELQEIQLFSADSSSTPDQVTFRLPTLSQANANAASLVFDVTGFSAGSYISFQIGKVKSPHIPCTIADGESTEPHTKKDESANSKGPVELRSIRITETAIDAIYSKFTLQLDVDVLRAGNNIGLASVEQVTVELAPNQQLTKALPAFVRFNPPKLMIADGKGATSSLPPLQNDEQQSTQKVLLNKWAPVDSKAYNFTLLKPTVEIECWHRWRARDQDEASKPEDAEAIKRDRIACLATHYQTLAEAMDFPDPKDHSTCDPAASEYLYLELVCKWSPSQAATKDKNALPRTRGNFFRLKSDGSTEPSGKRRNFLNVSCIPSDSLDISTDASGRCVIQIPYGEIWELRASALYPDGYFAPNASARFSNDIAGYGRVSADGSWYRRGPNFRMILEAADDSIFVKKPGDLTDYHFMIGEAIRSSLVFSGPPDNKQSLVLSFDRQAIQNERLLWQIAEIQVDEQCWRWDGRRIDEFPLAPSELGKSYAIRSVPSDPHKQKKDQVVEWDQWGFKNRQNSDFKSDTIRLPLQESEIRFVQLDLSNRRRSLYFRFRFKVFSRYYGLDHTGSLELTASFLVGSHSDEWLRVLVPYRFEMSKDRLPVPILNAILPLTQSSNARAAGDALVVLNEELYSVAGLGEFIEPVIAEVENHFEFGPDPILVSTTTAHPARTKESQEFAGFTFNPSMAYPPINQSGFILPPPDGVAGQPGSRRVQLDDPSWYFGKYSFRRLVKKNWCIDLETGRQLIPLQATIRSLNGFSFCPAQELIHTRGCSLSRLMFSN